MLSNHLILYHPLLLLLSIFPSIRVFSSELTLRIKWPKYWSFSFSISPSSEYSGLISLHPGDSPASSPVPQFKSINSKSFIFLTKIKNHLGFLEKNTFLGGFNVIRVASLLLNLRLIIKSTVLMKMFIFLGSSMQNLSAAQLTVVGKFLPFLLAVRFSCRWNSIVLHQNRSCRWKLWKQPWLSS